MAQPAPQKRRRKALKTEVVIVTPEEEAGEEPRPVGLTPQEYALLDELLRRIVRAFYPASEYTVVLDALLRHGKMTKLRGCDLSKKIGMQSALVRSVLRHLNKHLMVRGENMQEKRLAGNIHQHDCWWVDYKLAVDSIRYRLWLLEKHLRDKSRAQQDIGFFCEKCQMKYSSFEIADLMRNHSLCLRCNGQVTEIEGNVCDSLQDKDKEKFSREVQKIRNLLDRVKDIKIPTVTCIEVARYDAETGKFATSRPSSGHGRGGPTSDMMAFQIVVQIDSEAETCADVGTLEEVVPVEMRHVRKRVVNDDDKVRSKIPPWIRPQNATVEQMELIRKQSAKSEARKVVETVLSPEERSKIWLLYCHQLSMFFDSSYLATLNSEAMEEAWQEVAQAVITVEGQPRKVCEVTEQDLDRMTEKERGDYLGLYETTASLEL